MEVTLSLPENLYRNFTRLAEKKHRRIEDVIADKLRKDFSVENIEFEEEIKRWSDEDVLALANLKLPKEQAERMSELSDKNQSGNISKTEESVLDIYLDIYNNANRREAVGIAEAVNRGLISSTDDLK